MCNEYEAAEWSMCITVLLATDCLIGLKDFHLYHLTETGLQK